MPHMNKMLLRRFCSLMLLLAEAEAFTLTTCGRNHAPTSHLPGVSFTRLLSSSSNDHCHPDRRDFMLNGAFLLTALSSNAAPANARGLVQFPCKEPLSNTYHMMRVGQTMLEADDIWSTNPLFITNREAALSDVGKEQVELAASRLQDVTITAARYSLAASAMDTAGILTKELKLGRDLFLPEYTFMDPRAVGKWEMLPLSSTEPAVWAMDADEAGKEGSGGRPPPNEDSTPNETLANQAIRLRQLMSVLETLYSGDTILLVFPDGAGPALLSAMIAGIPYNHVHELEYSPGELRLDVTMASTLAFWKERKKASAAYSDVLATGRTELKRLRNMAPEDVVNVKDQQFERERLEDEALAAQREEVRKQRDEQDRLARTERARQVAEDLQLRKKGGQDDMGAVVPAVLGAVGIGAAGILALSSSDNKDLATESVPVPTANVTDSSTSLPTLIDGTPEIESSEALIAEDEDLDGLAAAFQSVQRVNGDRQATFIPKPKPLDKKKAAEEAMREYLDSDDGGQEWLQMMVDIATEEDDGEMRP